MVKIIYLDIDGTLRDEQAGIPDSAVLAIEQCRRHGIRIVICTGRNPGSIQSDVAALQTDGTISGGGCYASYHGEEIFKKHFSMDILKKALSIAGEGRLSLALEAERKIYMDHQAAVFYRDDIRHKVGDSEKMNRQMFLARNQISYEDNIKELRDGTPGIHKICMFGSRGAVEKAADSLKEETETIQKKEWNDRWYLELLPKGCDKGRAIRRLNRRLGIMKKESMSFGDSENDIAMMEATGIAVAVGGADPRIQRYAASVCEPVMEDGIYKELLRRNIILPFGKDPAGRRA